MMIQDQQDAQVTSPGVTESAESGLPLRSPLELGAIADQSGAAASVLSEEEPTGSRKTLTFIRELIETVLLTLVIFLAVRSVIVNYKVEGESMVPTLHNGEYLLVNKGVYFHFDANSLRNILPGADRQGRDVVYLFHPPTRGDIVVLDPPNGADKPYVKRVIGLPGDRIAVRDGKVYVNGKVLDEGYIAAPPFGTYPNGGGEYTVPAGAVFVMGDNRNNSSDSRGFGAVAYDRIIGKAIVAYWPPNEIGLIPHATYASVDGSK